MKLPAPFLTLTAGAVTGGVLLLMSHAAATSAASGAGRAEAAAPAATSAAGAAPAAPAAAPTTGASAAAGSAAAADPASAPALTPSADDAAGARRELSGYAGRVPDSRLGLQLAVRGSEAVAYVCDGGTVESWLRGEVDGRTVRLSSPQGDRLTATLGTGRAQVRLSAFGRSWSFRVSAVEPASVPAVTKRLAP